MKKRIERFLKRTRSKLRVQLPLFSWTSLKTAYRAAQLVQIVATLRGPDGCPWDRKQTLHSILPDLREEAMEAVEAGQGVLENTIPPLEFCQELGDVLFLVTFLSRFCQEDGKFDISDAFHQINTKMIRRHPHVFEKQNITQPEDVQQSWAKIKAQEKAQSHNTFHSILDDIPSLLPSLHLAQRISEKAITVGFDWDSPKDVWNKVDEELHELLDAMNNESQQRQEAELGDLLFTIVNLARHLKLDAENALISTCKRFSRRFQFMERQLHAQQRSIHETPQTQLEELWSQAKQNEKNP